jgi:hypothetical protein
MAAVLALASGMTGFLAAGVALVLGAPVLTALLLWPALGVMLLLLGLVLPRETRPLHSMHA